MLESRFGGNDLVSFVNQVRDSHGIDVVITPKAVKNVNFRLRGQTLLVSYPKHLSKHHLIKIITSRLDWAKSHQATIQEQSSHQDSPKLWGQVLDVNEYLSQHKQKLPTGSSITADKLLMEIYRHELSCRLDELSKKWQPIVGQYAHEIRLKRMKTRWGVCNVRDRRIWLSLYLAMCPYECTEYVFVHELCHLIHANHSKEFWGCVKKFMPDYEHWHNQLKQEKLPCVV